MSEFITFCTGENTPFAIIYRRANELSEFFLKWVLIVMETMYTGNSLVFIAVEILFFYLHDGYIEAEKLYAPLKIK